MTATVDTNIFVSAVHDASPTQPRARAFLDWVAAGPQVVHLFWPALLGFVRITTHPTILGNPLGREEAESAVERLLAMPHVRVTGESRRFWPTYRGVAADVQARGKLVPDAHLVALMKENGVSTIWTADRDFRKFDGITVKNPFDAKYADGFR